jgi:hypothetical protein
MSLELDGGKHVLAITGEWASSGLPLAPRRSRSRAYGGAGGGVCGGRVGDQGPQGSASRWRIRSHLDCETVSRQVPGGGSGADLIGNVAGGRPIKRRGRGVAAVVPEAPGKLPEASGSSWEASGSFREASGSFRDASGSFPDQIMPPWIVLVNCRASGHIWKSRQYKGNALGSAVHVTAT